MRKLVLIRLNGIQYSGDDVGPHFEFHLSLGSKESSFKVTCRHGRSKVFIQSIFQDFVHVDSTFKLILKVQENDPLYDDLGSVEKTVNLSGIEEVDHKKIETLRIKIYGRGWEENRVAILTLDLEIELDSGIRYISDVEPNGWLRVKLDSGVIHPLPYFLKVWLYEMDQAREYFEILEGRFKGKKASVKKKSKRSSYLLKGLKHLKDANLVYDLSQKELWVKGLGRYKTDMDELNPLNPGEYDLEIPYEPHSLGERYSRSSRYSKTWFRIGRSGDRFLHVGARSAGCISVQEYRKWTKIYNYLIRRHKDERSIGTLKVKK